MNFEPFIEHNGNDINKKFKSLQEFEEYQENNDISNMNINLSNLNINKLNKPIKCNNLNLSNNKLTKIDSYIECNNLDLSYNLISKLGEIDFFAVSGDTIINIYNNTFILTTTYLNKISCSKLNLSNNPIITNSIYFIYLTFKDKFIELIKKHIKFYIYYCSKLTFPIILLISLLSLIFISFNIYTFLKIFIFNNLLFISCFLYLSYKLLKNYDNYVVKNILQNNDYKIKYNINIPLIEIKASNDIINKEYEVENDLYIYKYPRIYKEIDDTCIVCYNNIAINKSYLCCNNVYRLHPVCHACFPLIQNNECLMCKQVVLKYFNSNLE